METGKDFLQISIVQHSFRQNDLRTYRLKDDVQKNSRTYFLLIQESKGNPQMPMTEEQIPAGLRKKFVQSSLYPGVVSTANTLEAHFTLSGVPFFREYTDHSFQHCIEVFRSACDVLSEDSIEIILSDDLNILMLACLLHDVGLHITEDVFLALVHPKNNHIAIPAFDQKSWPELWTDFVAEAKRFNAKKLISLFGDIEPVREPPISSIDMTQRDRLLIGEFLRRHHPRFAHELAIGATPTADGSNFELTAIEPNIQDISGLVARSHGIELRAAFDHIQTRYDLRDYNRIHIVFVMVLLRIADFLQIQAARAPALFKNLHNIRSPFSLGEWKLHQCIENITTSSFDPEAIHVAANPKTVHEYLRFEKWSKGLQSELDRSWAILGEVYGRFTREALNRLKLNIRRIRSNIEDKSKLEKTAQFVPDAISFRVAEPELLKLLMEPLYGDDPLYGLRELTQNSVDSVRELEHLKSTGNAATPAGASAEKITVEINDAPDFHFCITDQGTGMTLDTIKNYFLKAGASFRNSDLWKHNFSDDTGKAKVARSGRFGVGALSAFLIGDKLEVYSRHFTDKSGFGNLFQCKIDDDEIEIRKNPGPIGTSIKIWSNETRIMQLAKYLAHGGERPFYYNLETPKVAFSVTPAVMKMIPEIDAVSKQLSDAAWKPKPDWIEAKPAAYEKVVWDRVVRPDDSRGGRRSGFLYCNGILIGDVHEPDTELIFKKTYSIPNIDPPTVDVTDHNGALPLDLARKALLRPDEELAEVVSLSVCEDFLSQIFRSEATDPRSFIKWWREGSFFINFSSWIPFVFRSNGLCLLDRYLFNELNPRRLVVENSNDDQANYSIDSDFLGEDGCVIIRENYRSNSQTRLLERLRDSVYHDNLPSFSERFGADRPSFEKCFFALPESRLGALLDLAAVPNYIRAMLTSAAKFSVASGDCLLAYRGTSARSEDVGIIMTYLKKTTPHVQRFRDSIAIWQNHTKKDLPPTHLAKAWQESFNTLSIPYDPALRSRILKADAPILRYF